MSPTDSRDLQALLEHIESVLQGEFEVAPGRYPNDIELALIDAVLSIRAVYGKTMDTGVRMRVRRYRLADPSRTSFDDLERLARLTPVQLQEILGTDSRTGGVTKAEAIVTAAGRLLAAGVRRAADVSRTDGDQKRAYIGTRGLGPVTWAYFTMLTGSDGVKADTMILRFVGDAIGRSVTPPVAERLVSAAAQELGISAVLLDHTIWRHESAKARTRRPAKTRLGRRELTITTAG